MSMDIDAPSLPFFIPKVYEGLAKANGIARISPAGLTLEFQVKDSFVGMLTSEVREVHISIDDLLHLELRKGWFKTRLVIRTRRMAAVNMIPGNHVGGIELGVTRQDRKIAETLVSILALSRSERELENLENGRGG